VATILVIDDEPGILRFVKRALENEGHTVCVSTDGSDGLRRACDQPVDLVILDLAMPGLDGCAVLAALMARDPSQRVIVLSAMGDVVTRVRCLEAGAADFLCKPFAVRELLARVASRLKEGSTGHAPGSDVLTSGSLRLDLRRRTLDVDGRMVELSHREFLLMQHLMGKPGLVCTREELLSEVWGYAFDPGTNVVDVYIRRLRLKIQENLIGTVRNVGYTLRSA
jgi:DNA-binding response OmpR family regulator